MHIKQNSKDSKVCSINQADQKMKITSIFKTYTIKAYFLFTLISFMAGTPTQANAGFFNDLLTSVIGSNAQAETTQDANNTDINTNTDSYELNSQNLQVIGTDSVDPNIKDATDCTNFTMDDGALELTTCPFGKGIENTSSGEMVVYEVQAGDTLSEIAASYDVSINTIKWENNLTSQSVKVGQKLNILPVTGVKHIVKKGDNLDKIALKYEADVEDIMVFNDVSKSTALKQGDVLYIPNGIIKPVIIVQRPSSIKKYVDDDKYVPSSISTGYYIRPANGPITSPYGSRRGSYHYGIDIGNVRGTAVVAAASGTVVETLASCKEGKRSCGGRYGNYIIIQHDNGTFTRYAHLSRVSVSVGENVSRVEQIGTIGNTGRSTGPHLHFQIEKSNGSTIRPQF